MHYYHHFDPGPGPWAPSPVAQLLYFGFANLFWLGLVGILLWSAIQSLHYHGSLPSQAEEPSALELLRRRYVLGETDVTTFEDMLQELLESEQLERPYRVQPPSLL